MLEDTKNFKTHKEKEEECQETRLKEEVDEGDKGEENDDEKEDAMKADIYNKNKGKEIKHISEKEEGIEEELSPSKHFTIYMVLHFCTKARMTQETVSTRQVICMQVTYSQRLLLWIPSNTPFWVPFYK